MIDKALSIHEFINPNDKIDNFEITLPIARSVVYDVKSKLQNFGQDIYFYIMNTEYQRETGIDLAQDNNFYYFPVWVVINKTLKGDYIWACNFEVCLCVPKLIAFYSDMLREDTKLYHYSYSIGDCVKTWLFEELYKQLLETSLRIAHERNDKVFNYA